MGGLWEKLAGEGSGGFRKCDTPSVRLFDEQAVTQECSAILLDLGLLGLLVQVITADTRRHPVAN
jgi:hypothetical protein